MRKSEMAITDIFLNDNYFHHLEVRILISVSFLFFSLHIKQTQLKTQYNRVIDSSIYFTYFYFLVLV